MNTNGDDGTNWKKSNSNTNDDDKSYKNTEHNDAIRVLLINERAREIKIS